MKILVTGGAGFIASQIADAFINEGHDVFILDNLATGFEKNVNPKATFIKKDIGDKSLSELFEKEKFDVVNHHAAQMDVRRSVADPAFDANTNIFLRQASIFRKVRGERLDAFHRQDNIPVHRILLRL